MEVGTSNGVSFGVSENIDFKMELGTYNDSGKSSDMSENNDVKTEPEIYIDTVECSDESESIDVKMESGTSTDYSAISAVSANIDEHVSSKMDCGTLEGDRGLAKSEKLVQPVVIKQNAQALIYDSGTLVSEKDAVLYGGRSAVSANIDEHVSSKMDSGTVEGDRGSAMTEKLGQPVAIKRNATISIYHSGTLVRENNTVFDSNYLRNFSQLSHPDKVNVIRRGRPMPDIALVQSRGGRIVRRFNVKRYGSNDWLCGCVTTNKLFCFPCLLFSTESHVPSGFSDLANMTYCLRKHEQQLSHYQNSVALKMFGRATNLASDQQELINEVHDKKVKKNRAILTSVISATCFLIKQGLPFYGGNENFIELLNYTAQFNAELSHHLELSSFLPGPLKTLHIDLLDSIAMVLRNSIKDEIKEADFIALEIDEAKSVSDTTVVSTVLRYVVDCTIKEVFVGFVELVDKTPPNVTKSIFKTLDEYGCVSKLVAFTIDGTTIIAPYLHDVQKKLKERAPFARFIHSYAHSLDHILLQSAKQIVLCRVFFETLDDLALFFNVSSKRAQSLNMLAESKKLNPTPTAAPINWSSTSKVVHTILHNHDELCDFFRSIEKSDNPELWDADTILRSPGFLKWLSMDTTYFLLHVFDRIFSVINTLNSVLPTQPVDVQHCSEKVSEVVDALDAIRNEFEAIDILVEKHMVGKMLSESNQIGSTLEKDKRRVLFYGIIVFPIREIKVRCQDFENLKFISLLDRTQSVVFEEAALISLEKQFGFQFNIPKLKNDLGVISHIPEFCNKSSTDILKFIVVNDLKCTFSEAVKLMQLTLTFPVGFTPVDNQSFSTLKRIESYTGKRVTTESFSSSLALASIEKERLLKMEKDPEENFYRKVIDTYATTKDTVLELKYSGRHI